MNSTRDPTIAVLVPNWNDAKYLPKCLRSVLDQSRPPDEFVIVDDCSTDNSVEIMRAVAGNSPFVKIVPLAQNRGVYGAVAEGMKHITSDYVLFLSANDFVLPGIFECAHRTLSAGNLPGLWSALAWLVDETDRPPCLCSPDLLRRTSSRFRFAAVRACEGRDLSSLARYVAGMSGVLLSLADRVLPAAARRVRIGVAFLLLRPFDVVPTVFHRLLGWLWTSLRLRMSGQRAPE